MHTPPVGRQEDTMQGDTLSIPASPHALPAVRAEVSRAAVFAVALGCFLVYLTGFAHTDALHNGAHNTRHALSFPCH